MKILTTALLAALPLSLAPMAQAQQRTFAINPTASQVDFSLGGNTHQVHGIFHVQSGKVEFDPTAKTISGFVEVAASSGDSGEKSRDKKMDKDVLETQKFAQISFVPKSYTGDLAATGDSTIQVSGVFTLHGAPHDITVPMQIHIEGSNLTAKGQFTVPYVKWGLKDPSVFILKVAKEVGIDLTLVGTVQ